MYTIRRGMSNYQNGAYEALQWAWHMLRNYSDQPNGIEEARRVIRETLAQIGNGEKINFRKKISPIIVS